MTAITEITQVLEKLNQYLGISSTQSSDTAGTTRFSLNFNPGTFYNGFLKPYVTPIQSVFKAVDPVIQLLTTRIPPNDVKETSCPIILVSSVLLLYMSLLNLLWMKQRQLHDAT